MRLKWWKRRDREGDRDEEKVRDRGSEREIVMQNEDKRKELAQLKSIGTTKRLQTSDGSYKEKVTVAQRERVE